jgi:acyl-CoA dehydrogenase
MYGLSEQDRQIQARARAFADELIPFEDEAERSGAQLPAELTAAHAKRARELGLHSTNMPKELGGGGCTALQQVLVQEQMGRVTNALGWVAATPPSWLPAVATADQLERYVKPAIDGEREECYAITEEGAGSDVDAIEATARRVGDQYLLNGVKWHVTSFNTADYAFFQARLAGGPHDGEHAMTCPAPGCGWSGPRRTRTRSATTIRSSRSTTCASRPPTWSEPKATGWPSPMSGSGSSG